MCKRRISYTGAAVILLLLLSFTLAGCGKTAPASKPNTESSVSDISGQTAVLSDDMADSEDSKASLEAKTVSAKEVIAVLAALPDRVPGSENNEKAVQWITEQYALLGLKPLMKEDYCWPYTQSIASRLLIVNNVVGYIAGSNSEQAVVISCHFDAVEGSTGAVDNASGVGAMLCTAANIAAAENKPKADIIFCAFNGEEQDYSGSKAFVEEFKGQYETVCNINYDCVGVIDGGDYTLGVETAEAGYALNMAMRPYLEKYKIKYCSYPVSGIRSDHISFENAKIPNINFTQVGVMSVIHSSSDQADKLDSEQINLLSDCVTEYLLKEDSKNVITY